MRNWTPEEMELAATYGFCEFCGGPRTIGTERHKRDDALEITLLLICAWCGREPSDDL